MQVRTAACASGRNERAAWQNANKNFEKQLR